MAIECYEFKIEGISRGMHVQNVLHYNCDNDTDALPLEIANELCNVWDSDVKEWWLDMLPESYAIRWISARRVIPKHSNTSWKEYPDSVAQGTRGVNTGPTAVAPIIKLFGGLDTPVQGRVFLPPPAEISLANNVYDGGFVDAVVAFIDHNLTFTSTHDFSWAIFSRKNNQGVGVSQAALSAIIGQIGGRRRPL